MTSMARKSPSNIAPTQDFADISPKPRIASGTLAADAPEFIPGDRKTSDVSSDRDEARAAEKKLKKRSRRYKKRPRVDEEVDAEVDEALKQQAIDEEWWSGDDVFVPDLKDNEDLWSDELN